MYIKWNVTGFIAFAVLGSVIYFWGPGWSAWWRAVASCALYGAVFFASFVVVRRR